MPADKSSTASPHPPPSRALILSPHPAAVPSPDGDTGAERQGNLPKQAWEAGNAGAIRPQSPPTRPWLSCL